MMTRDELIAETECECQLGGGPGMDRKEMTRRESVRRDVDALYARLNAAEKCIAAVQSWRNTHACDEHASVMLWCFACCDVEVADEAVVDALNAWEATK